MRNIINFQEFNEEVSLKKIATGLALATGLSMAANQSVDAETKFTNKSNRISNKSRITFDIVDEDNNLFKATYKSPESSQVKSIIFESNSDHIDEMLDFLESINNNIFIETSELPFEVDTIPNHDTATIRLPVGVMRSIAQDLLRKDSLEEENKLLWKSAEILTNNLRLKDILISQKDSIISLKNHLLSTKDTIISFNNRSLQMQKGLSLKLEKEIKSQKRRNIRRDSSLIVIILVLLFLQVR